MLEIKHKVTLPAGATTTDSVALDHLQRQKGRLKVLSRSGVELRIFLERGNTLLRGEVLQASSGEFIEVDYCDEPVVTARCTDWLSFCRACYHLGNRHVQLQIDERWLRFAPDPVLEELATLLGLDIEHHEAIFDPEPGAYHKARTDDARHLAHSHSHAHE